MVDLRFANNAGGRLTTLTSTAMQWRITYYGTSGWAELQDQDTLVIQPLEGQRETLHYPGFEYPATATLSAALEAFAADIRGGPPFAVTPAQILQATNALEAIIRSAPEERRIEL
jgi:predicted dehydrogenase